MKRKYNRQEVDNSIRQYAGVKSCTNIADMCGVVTSTVSNYARMMGLSLVIIEKVEKRKVAEEFIKENYSSVTCAEAATRLDLKPQVAHYYAEELGLRFKSGRKEKYRTEKIQQREGIFNVMAKSNWLL